MITATKKPKTVVMFIKKNLKTNYGDVELKVPCGDRNRELEPQIVKKQQSTLTGDIEDKIIYMYAKGMTTNDIESHIQKIYSLYCPILRLVVLPTESSLWSEICLNQTGV